MPERPVKWMLVLLWLLATCAGAAPGEPEPGATAPPPTRAGGPPPSARETPPTATLAEPATTVPPPPTGAAVPVVPVTVDLRQVTPAVDNPSPEALPAPGVPRPQSRLEDRVRHDLAQRLGVAEADVAVAGTEAVTWPDGALGCPGPAPDTITVLVPGYKILLQAGGTAYTYHTDREDRFVLCQDGRPAPA